MTNTAEISRSKNGSWTTFILDNDLNLINIINPNSKIILKGNNNADIIGANIINYLGNVEELNKKSARLISANVRKVKESGKPSYFECPFNQHDGSVIFALCYIEIVDNGYVYCHAIEINSKQLIDGRRAFIDNALLSGMNSVAAGIYTKQYDEDDPRGYRYIFFNSKAKELFGNKNITKSPYWNQQDEDERDLKVIKEGVKMDYERCIKDADGSEKWFRVFKKSVDSIAGYEYVLTTVFDITTMKEEEIMCQKARDKAELSDKFKSAFLANMSHEIRTPLNAIIGFSRLLPFVDSPDEREEYLNIININNDLLLKLIEDILDLSKMEAGFISIKREDFDIADLYIDIDRVFSLKTKEGVKIINTVSNDNLIVNLDKNRTLQILTNFVSNAAKFTNHGYIKMGYTVDDKIGEKGYKGLTIFVEDSGCGISAEDMEKVFERFVKLNAHIQGFGLGMAICRSIVDANNGKLWAESIPGKGSTFYAYLPDCVI